MTAESLIIEASTAGVELFAKPDGTLGYRGPAAAVATRADEEAIAEAIEERAAIREYDGGETRGKAEQNARAAMRVFRYRVTDKPDVWLTLICPGCDPAEARRHLELQFRDRLLDVREHPWRARR
jgi:hypothetical protein